MPRPSLLLVLAVSLLAPASARGERCVVDVTVLNLDREVRGPVNAECSRPHSIPFGNWGAEFPYFGSLRLRDGYQFSGWKADDGWLQWNSCTRDFRPAEYPHYYNADNYTTQTAVPNVVNVVESRREHTLTGPDGVTCKSLRTNPVIDFSAGTIELRVYELDRRIPLIDGPDHVATLSYAPLAVRYSCKQDWSCRGESAWVSPESGAERVSARLKLKVHLRKEP